MGGSTSEVTRDLAPPSCLFTVLFLHDVYSVSTIQAMDLEKSEVKGNATSLKDIV